MFSLDIFVKGLFGYIAYRKEMAKLVLKVNLVALDVDNLSWVALFFYWVMAKQDFKHAQVVAKSLDAKDENVLQWISFLDFSWVTDTIVESY